MDLIDWNKLHQTIDCPIQFGSSEVDNMDAIQFNLTKAGQGQVKVI